MMIKKINMTPADTDKSWGSHCSYANSRSMAEYLSPRHSDAAWWWLCRECSYAANVIRIP